MVETQSQVCKTCKQVCAVSPLSGGSCASGKADGVAGLLSESAVFVFLPLGNFPYANYPAVLACCEPQDEPI